jgi:RHS repeat-associated protein
MQSALSQAFSEPLLAAMPQLSEKPHQGVPSSNPALYLGHEVCKSTTALGLRAALHLERVQSRSTGKERDAESGNDYFDARYYSSAVGRFMSPDWAEDPSNVPYATFSDPQSLNLYSYGLNNPLKNRDSDGHSCDPDYTTTNANGDTVVHAGACHLDWWDLPGHAWVGLANLMTASTPKQAATGAGQMFYAYSAALPFAQIGVGLGAADGLISLGLEADGAGAAGEGAAVETGAQSTDVTTGKSIKNWKTNATPDQVGKTLESNGFEKKTLSDGSVQYSKGNTDCTMYPKAKSTGGPSMQVKVNNVPVSKVRMK